MERPGGARRAPETQRSEDEPLLSGSAGYALQSTYGSFGMMAGPAVGGILIGAIGLTGTYSVDAATYALAFAAFTTISPSPPVGAAHGASVASVLHGLRFLRGQPVVVSVFGIDLITMVFGMPIAPSPR